VRSPRCEDAGTPHPQSFSPPRGEGGAEVRLPRERRYKVPPLPGPLLQLSLEEREMEGMGFWMDGAVGVLMTLGSLNPHPGPLPVEGRGWRKRLSRRICGVYRVLGSGLVSRRGNGTSGGVGFYGRPGNP